MSRSGVNRVVLAVAGVLLLAVGLLVLAGGLDLYRHLGLDMPHWWPLTSPDQPLLSDASRTRWTDRSWWWPVVIGGLSLIVLLGLWWLVAQFRRPAPSSLALPTPAGTGLRLRLRTKALEEALESGTDGLPGVQRARMKVVGRRTERLTVHGVVLLSPGGDPAALVEGFDAGPLDQARSSLALAALPARLRLRVAARKPAATPKHPRVI
ncbi:alkaline shock response membrane anchor protein AmaP [Kitasatospora sp. NBC_00240]|uniref:alkaline shock response membrane anchor protein AmaP n=1 Tax=Kitasatospora sp. NBC_00240 TaxID=2903567 RepID=UPI002250BBBA|nr:alkaline shock response membrane anchor protein AmaP [Kitasatospora sp. NBC_00240]MCX5210182.1 alkaline shock response membrane anchor protein AmaP [Kitasatospora sp. NBC_00240]